jgi:acetyl esterase/lipase
MLDDEVGADGTLKSRSGNRDRRIATATLASSSGNALAAFRSAVSNPSVNQPQTEVSRSRTLRRSCLSARSRANVVAVRSSRSGIPAGQVLTREKMAFYWSADVPHAADLTRPPPVVVLLAELDVLCLEGETLAAKLRAAAVSVETNRVGELPRCPARLSARNQRSDESARGCGKGGDLDTPRRAIAAVGA